MKPKAPTRLVKAFPELEPINELLRKPPLTTEDRLMHIQALGQRIEGYIKFMCAVGSLDGSSLELKQTEVAAFYDCLVILEPPLGRIPKKLQRRRRFPLRCK
jgi:hypothetical protein